MTELKADRFTNWKISSSPFKAAMTATTPDGWKVSLRVDPMTALTIMSEVAGIIGTLEDAQHNLQVDQTLERINNRISDLRFALVEIVKLLESMGDRLEQDILDNTIRYIKTLLLAQIEVFVSKLPKMRVDADYAKLEALKLLDQFENSSAQLRGYGTAPFDTVFIAMVHHYALFKYAQEDRANRKATFGQYFNYFSRVYSGDIDSLSAIAKHNIDIVAELKPKLEALPREVKYSYYTCRGHGQWEVWFVFDHGVEEEYTARREDRNFIPWPDQELGGVGGAGESRVIPSFSIGHEARGLTFHSARKRVSDPAWGGGGPCGDDNWEWWRGELVRQRNEMRATFLEARANYSALSEMIATALQAGALAASFVAEFS